MKLSGAKQVERICLFCGNAFITKASEIKRGGGLYCNMKCFHAYQSMAVRNATSKICSKCGVEKPIELFHLNEGRGRTCKECFNAARRPKCKVRYREFIQRYQQTHGDIYKRSREYSLMVLENHKKRYANDPEFRKKMLEKAARARILLSDYYVATTLKYQTGLSAKEIRRHPELLEVQRLYIIAHRAIKSKKRLNYEEKVSQSSEESGICAGQDDRDYCQARG